MQSNLSEVIYDIELEPGEPLRLPEDATKIFGPGHWLVSIKPVSPFSRNELHRDHSAFLASYTPEDEGLYDDYPSR